MTDVVEEDVMDDPVPSTSLEFNPVSHLKNVILEVGKANQARLNLLCKKHRIVGALTEDVAATMLSTMADSIEIFRDYVPGYVMEVATKAFRDVLDASASTIRVIPRETRPPINRIQTKKDGPVKSVPQKPLPGARVEVAPTIILESDLPTSGTPASVKTALEHCLTTVLHVPSTGENVPALSNYATNNNMKPLGSLKTAEKKDEDKAETSNASPVELPETPQSVILDKDALMRREAENKRSLRKNITSPPPFMIEKKTSTFEDERDDIVFESWCQTNSNMALINDKFWKLINGWKYSFKGQPLLPMIRQDPSMRAALVLIAFPATFFDVNSPSHQPFCSALQRKCNRFIASVCNKVFKDRTRFNKHDLMYLLLELDKICKSSYWVHLSIIEIRKAAKESTELDELSNEKPSAIRLPDDPPENPKVCVAEYLMNNQPFQSNNSTIRRGVVARIQGQHGQILVKQNPQCSRARYVKFPKAYTKVNLAEWLDKNTAKVYIEGIIEKVWKQWNFAYRGIKVKDIATTSDIKISLAIFHEFDRFLVQSLDLVSTAREKILEFIKDIMVKGIPTKKYTILQLEIILRELDRICKTDYFRTLNLTDVGLKESRKIRPIKRIRTDSEQEEVFKLRREINRYEEDFRLSNSQNLRPQRLVLRPPKEPQEMKKRKPPRSAAQEVPKESHFEEADAQITSTIAPFDLDVQRSFRNLFKDNPGVLDNIPSGLRCLVSDFEEPTTPLIMKQEVPED